MLYHYTSIQALEGILKESPSEKGLCFWASRYDCFGDKEEYKIGIETIKVLLPKVEIRLQPDRRVSSSFDWNSIKKNKMLPMPYVISLTKRCDNNYMWENYADHGCGVVLALDETKEVSFEGMPHMIMLKPCLYKGQVSDDELFKEIEKEFFYGAFRMLSGPKKNFAFGLIKDYPQVFVKLIAMYLLGYVAPRIKDSEYHLEEEIRIIIPSQRPSSEVISQLNQLRESKIMDINIDLILQMVESEKQRKRYDGVRVYYRELFLPSNMLSKIYMKNTSKISDVKNILSNKGFGDREIVIIK